MNEHDLRAWLITDKCKVAGDRQPCATGQLIFRDYGAPVLAVAHLDVCGGTLPKPQWDNVDVVRSPALDDRLGAWVLTQLIEDGMPCDLLLTDNEETGASTAADFVPPRDYLAVVSLDRMGVDCVLYQYEGMRRWRKLCARLLGPIAFGSYSCIASLDHLATCGVNIGVGYYGHNTDRCWADLRLTRAQMLRTRAFVDHIVARGKRYGYVDLRAQRETKRGLDDLDPPTLRDICGDLGLDDETGRIYDTYELIMRGGRRGY